MYHVNVSESHFASCHFQKTFGVMHFAYVCSMFCQRLGEKGEVEGILGIDSHY